MSPARGATSGASIHTDPDRARRVIEESRRDFDTACPGVRFEPVVGLVCAYEEEENIGAVLAAMPAEACGLYVTTLVVVDGGGDATDKVARESGAVTFVLRENLGHGYALRVGYALCIELGARYVVTLDADGQNDPFGGDLAPVRKRHTEEFPRSAKCCRTMHEHEGCSEDRGLLIGLLCEAASADTFGEAQIVANQ